MKLITEIDALKMLGKGHGKKTLRDHVKPVHESGSENRKLRLYDADEVHALKVRLEGTTQPLDGTAALERRILQMDDRLERIEKTVQEGVKELAAGVKALNLLVTKIEGIEKLWK
jgi:hypothetical protein